MVLTRRKTSSSKEESDKGTMEGDQRSNSGYANADKRSPPSNPNKVLLERTTHSMHVSLLSSKSGFNNYRGFVNLAVLIMIMHNFRLVLENLLKYGFLFKPLEFTSTYVHDVEHFPTLTLFLTQIFFISACVMIEKQASRKSIWLPLPLPYSLRTVLFLHSINIIAQISLPIYVIYYYIPNNAIGASFTLSSYTITFMKLISYVSVNHWYRSCEGSIDASVSNKSNSRKTSGTAGSVKYPENVTFRDMIYFTFAPTLCYEINFPRTPYIRIRFLLRRAGETIFLTILLFALGQQWIVPTVQNSVVPMQNMDWQRVIERILKLAVPNHFLWLIFFYTFFHCYLNFLGELLRFGDRCFYKDWWNSTTITYFWQNWNIPVHKWATRHLYLPLVLNGYSKGTAWLVVFSFSAFFHELLVSLPLHMFKVWSFSGKSLFVLCASSAVSDGFMFYCLNTNNGKYIFSFILTLFTRYTAMLFQIPLAIVTEKWFKGSTYGNIIVWLSLVFGQPVAILMYVNDYLVKSMNSPSS
eukprot:Nk52_evm99s221 gene=Nk52_evmTU99s221